MKKTTLQFLDHIDQPVFVVGVDGAVINSNPKALNCLDSAAGCRITWQGNRALGDLADRRRRVGGRWGGRRPGAAGAAHAAAARGE